MNESRTPEEHRYPASYAHILPVTQSRHSGDYIIVM